MPETGARLTILNGPLAGKELALEEAVDNVLIGSDGSCRFHIPSPGISPIHARIWKDAGGITVYDTHSPRGLYINDNRVDGQAPLKNGDILWLGTPGEEEAVMIQVRLAPRGAGADTGPSRSASSEEPEIVEETVTMASLPVPPAERESPAEFAVAEPEDSDATMLEMAAEAVGDPVVEEADATVLDFSPRAPAPVAPPEEPDALVVAEPEDTEATRFVPSGFVAPEPDEHATIARMPEQLDEPVRFAVDVPTPRHEPPTFEDETADMPAVALPPPPPPAPVWKPPTPAPPIAPPPPAPTPRPAAAPPARPGPRPPVRAAAPAPPRPAPARVPSAGARNAAIVAVGALLLAGAGVAAWKLRDGSAPSAEVAAPSVKPDPPPTTAPAVPPPTQVVAPEPVPEPPVEEAVTIVKDAPSTTLAIGASPRPTPAGKAATPPPVTVAPEVARAQQAAQQVASLLGRADAAAAARDYSGASGVYEEVLKLEPGNARAMEGRAQAQGALASLRKGFVAGRTTVTGGKAAKGGLSGFDSEDVSVAKALDYSGRIDFEASPRNVKAGDSYNVQVYLTNDGKKGFKIGNVSMTTAVNGTRSGGPTAVRTRDVEPGQRVLLTEVPGTWQASTTSWSLEVVVTSSRNDTFRSQLSWR